MIQEEEGIDCQTCCPVGTSGVGDGKIPTFFSTEMLISENNKGFVFILPFSGKEANVW